MTYVMKCPVSDNCCIKSCAHRKPHKKLPSCLKPKGGDNYDCPNCTPISDKVSFLEKIKRPAMMGVSLGTIMYIYYQIIVHIILEYKY